MAKKNSELYSDNILEEQIVSKEDNLPEIVADEVRNADNSAVERKVKVKLIKDLPRIFIINNFYSGLRGETLLVPESVAYILKGSDNKTDIFAV